MTLITWDDRKNEDNYKKHGIWFEEALEVDLNPLSLMAENDHPSGERLEYLGYSTAQSFLYVVTAEPGAEAEIRILSARRGSLRERKIYEEGI